MESTQREGAQSARTDPEASGAKVAHDGPVDKASRDGAEIGRAYSHVYPFVRENVTLLDDEGGRYETLSWKPGVRFEPTGAGDSYDAVCDELGRQILTVQSVHKPGRFPTRVFYTRQWQTPDGKTFGKGNLRIATLNQFQRLCRGYRHPYELAADV